MREKRYLIDTTLRDGEQSPGFSFNAETKAKIALLLDRAGIHQIEAGIPVMGSYEKETIIKIMENRKRAKISTWNRMNKMDIQASFDCNPDIIHISVPVSYPHIYSMLKKNKAWIRKNLQECVYIARERSYTVTVGFQDASRADMTFMISLANLLKEMGTSCIRVADTVGILTPTRIQQIINDFTMHTDIEIGIHAHNDLGMAVSNSVAAAKAGAMYIDTTLFGIGERAGNCDLKKFIFATENIFDLRPSYKDAVLVEDSIRDLIFPAL
ncbi:MAG: homocitrate synthase [Clostridia bacterium]|nr:homocitrate synthase [Clostridia bacterium]